MKFIITISLDEDGMFTAECPSIPGCVCQGKTEEEAQMNIREAIKDCLEVRAERGLPLTVTGRQIEVVITRHGKAAGVLRGFASEEDWFEYRLLNDPKFLKRIQKARRDVRAGKGVSIEALKEEANQEAKRS
jgi:predicted RNase H-like HicB family nuclease